MAPGCGIPATAPPVNVFAMTKAVYDVGPDIFSFPQRQCGPAGYG